MNDIEKASWRFKLFRFTLYPFWALKWFLKRQKLLFDYLTVVRYAHDLEKEIQAQVQKTNDAIHAGKEKEAYYGLGFINGIRFCLRREWKHGRSGTK